MLGHAEKRGVLNPNGGNSAEALLPLPLDELGKFGFAKLLTDAVARPWIVTAAARGIRATAANKRSDALLNVSNRPSDINIYQMPTIIVSAQLPRNQPIAMQRKRLPLSMVAPVLAWAPS